MLVVNKQTKEKINISYSDFLAKFSADIKVALSSYVQSENAKPYFKLNKTPEDDFYFDLQWNFNHFGNSLWYIERM